MQFAVQVPLNSLSFGQVSFNLLYEFYKLGLNPHIFKASDHQIDFSAYDFEQDFTSWIIKNHNEALLKHNRNIPCIRLWHINDSLRTYSNRQILLTFHETDQLTPIEANILKNSEVCVTSKYTQDVFANSGVSSSIVHLGFDSNHFKILDKKYFDDGRITFNLCGKYEKRKHHTKIVKAWIKKYGIPLALYVDLKNVYIGPKELSHLQKACDKLGIRIIKAYSPQAKGRVERNHAVYQDRFVKDLKLNRITTIKAANQLLKNGFVDDLNQKFSKSPANPISAHRELGKVNLNDILCWEYERVMNHDFTFNFQKAF